MDMLPIANKKELEIMADLERHLNNNLVNGYDDEEMCISCKELKTLLFFLAKAATGQPSFTEHIKVAEKKAIEDHKEWLEGNR